MKYVTISDNAEVGMTDDGDNDALLVLTPEQAKQLLVELTAKMHAANIV